MKFTPKELNGNVNVSRVSPLKEFFVLVGGILGIIFSVYIALGMAIELVVSRLPAGLEQRLGMVYSSMYETDGSTAAENELQRIVDDLSKEIPGGSKSFRYRVNIADNPQVNALALPGGNIVVFSGLLKEMGSENELAFVLAHELGHFANRDHLKGIGRGLVLMAISFALLGGDSSVTEFIMNSTVSVEMKFSQGQESDADLWALDLLNKRYGHVSGAEDFFERVASKEKMGRILYYFSTHPFPEDRINRLRARIEKKGYLLKEKKGLSGALAAIK